MKLKFSKATILSSLYWYRGVTNSSPTASPRIYTMSGQLIGNGIGISEATRVVGWYRVDFFAPVKLEANTEYLIGFHFLNGAPIGSGNTPTPTVFQISEGLSLTYNSMYSGTTDIMPTTVNNNVLLSIGFDYITYSNKFLISSEDQYYSYESMSSKSLVAPMTSNTSTNGQSSASSIASTNFDSWKAFDGLVNTQGWSTSVSLPQWIQYKFNEPVLIDRYSLSSSTQTTAPVDWMLQGSNDGSSWTDLDIRQNEVSWSDATTKIFSFTNEKSFIFFRVYIIRNNGATNTALSEVQFYSKEINTLVSLDYSENNFLSHGIEKSSLINLYSDTHKRKAIVQDNSQLGAGKVFKQKIDTSKTPIKKASIT